MATLLDAALADPDRPFGLLPLLDADQYREQVQTWNATDREFDRQATVHDLFERRVDAAPDAVALAFESATTLTYAELDRRANRLAHRLRGLGVVPETRVALCVERSPDLVVAVLGVLKAGGAYVPVDPTYPAERIAFMLADSAAPVVVTQTAVRDRIPAGAAHLVDLDADSALGDQPEHRPGARSRPGRPGLRDLHLRLHRPAQGRGGRTPLGRQLHRHVSAGCSA